ncbi:histidine kinase [Xanthocytophaga agilis]|uniref:histidine kinase n=1 Tax=Xanthocytophaga agilis TaxID=3048010 RepID=A0AAE3QZ05_9BACT|nr:histidine kinase [Xanthocytophaga agilis]MDJ1500726.1 histidine kinase [Xanthocytophaga agilis]
MSHTLLDKNIYRKFTRLYIIALTIVAFLSILGQVLVQIMIHNQSNDSWIINYAGRQRFQSQAIAKITVILADRGNQVDTAFYRGELRNWIRSWSKYHHELKSGKLTDLNVFVKNSREIERMFQDIDPDFEAVRRSARNVQHELMYPGPASKARIDNDIAFLLSHERLFLQKMEKIVAQYGEEAKAKIDHLRSIEISLLIITLVVLLLEALFVFRPAVYKLRQTILALIDAEYHTREMNEELKSLNQSLEETREELIAATQLKYTREIEEQRMRTAYVIQGQEEERKRLARDLHDDLGQMLTALKLGIENLDGGAEWTPKGRKRLDDIKQLIAQTINEVRMVSFNLMPSVLNDFGIVSALRLLTSQVDASSSSVQVLFHSNLTEERFSKDVEISLYRIAQESLNNAIKYAEADSIRVELLLKRKMLYLNIIDDGKGFNYSEFQQKAPKDRAYHGLMHMKERARLINGELTISSTIDEGTQIHVIVPLPNAKK